MGITAAFLSPKADDLFSSVAAFTDTRELGTLDVQEGQHPARTAIKLAVANALRNKRSEGCRIALVKGDAGSGKTHVLSTTLAHAASMPWGEVYPVVLQLTSPVKQSDYDVWLQDAVIRELSARHFTNQDGFSPLRRLAGRLLGKMTLDQQDEFRLLIDDIDDDGEVELALRFAKRIHRQAIDELQTDAPPEGFIAAILLAGFADSSALNYLRRGVTEKRLKPLGLDEIKRPHERIELLRHLALVAQIVGAAVVFAFDQVENAVRLGSEGLFVHALTQAVRLESSIPNLAVIIVVLSDEYDAIVGGKRSAMGLPVSDKDRIENQEPFPARLDLGNPEFRRRVVAQRLAVLRERAQLAAVPGSLAPLPAWFLTRMDAANSIRLALREVALFRAKALELQRLPTETEYGGIGTPAAGLATLPTEPEVDYDKEWADFLDLAPATRNRLLDSTKADLLVWWLTAASGEQAASDPVKAKRSALDDIHQTPVIDIEFTAGGRTIELRQLALCEAKNSARDGVAAQIERFLDIVTGIPAILTTRPLPTGKTALVAAPLKKLSVLGGLKLDLGETEWHNLQRARDFAEKVGNGAGFKAWQRDKQWLSQLLSPLQPLIAHPANLLADYAGAGEPVDGSNGAVEATAPAGNEGSDAPTTSQVPGRRGRPPKPQATDLSLAADTTSVVQLGPRAPAAPSPQEIAAAEPFPVHIGMSVDGRPIAWDPYRAPPNHLNNASVLVTGDAGSGKTQTIRVLIDAACREGLSVTLFDFKADYCDPQFAGPLGIQVVDVRATGLPFNPLQPPPRGASGVQPIEHAYELAGVLSRVFRLGPVQQGLLRDAIAAVYTDAGIAPREWIDPAGVAWPSFDAVVARLRDVKGAAALVTKLSQLTDLGLFPASDGKIGSFEAFINARVCLKLSDLPGDDIKSALAELIIIQLHGFALRGDQPRRLKRVMVFDEAHRVKDSQRLESLAREGRAFGVGIVIGTQFPGDIPEQLAGNLATQLFLMNNQAAHRKFVAGQLLGTTSGREGSAMMEKLGNLKPLEGVFTNAHYSGGVFLTIMPHYQRMAA